MAAVTFLCDCQTNCILIPSMRGSKWSAKFSHFFPIVLPMPIGNPFPESQRDVVDLRSDTVTRPTPEMYEAMLQAPLGDDVLGDEPTVTKLEKLAAEKLGKQAAVFVPSGTMGNQIALATHTKPGDAVLIEEEAHIIYYEVGAPGVISGVVTFTLPSHRG